MPAPVFSRYDNLIPWYILQLSKQQMLLCTVFRDLTCLTSSLTQKIESPALGDGNYLGYVKLETTSPFTLKDPDANIVYGANL